MQGLANHFPAFAEPLQLADKVAISRSRCMVIVSHLSEKQDFLRRYGTKQAVSHPPVRERGQKRHRRRAVGIMLEKQADMV